MPPVPLLGAQPPNPFCHLFIYLLRTKQQKHTHAHTEPNALPPSANRNTAHTL